MKHIVSTVATLAASITLALSISLLPSCAPSDGPSDDAPAETQGPQCAEPTEAMIAEGRAIYAGKGLCYTCHGDAGIGMPAIGPNLVDETWLNTDGSYAGIAAVVRTGVATPVEHAAGMPAMGGVQLTDAEICAVSAYVHSLGAGR